MQKYSGLLLQYARSKVSIRGTKIVDSSQPCQGYVQQTYCGLVLMMLGGQWMVIDSLTYLLGTHATVSLLHIYDNWKLKC